LNEKKGQIYACSARIELEIPGALTLKDRRAVIRSLLERLKGRFNLSVSDLDGGENGAGRAVLGVAAVSNEMRHAQDMARKAVEFIEEDGRVEVLEAELRDA
jgi:uncharacterized protein